MRRGRGARERHAVCQALSVGGGNSGIKARQQSVAIARTLVASCVRVGVPMDRRTNTFSTHFFFGRPITAAATSDGEVTVVDSMCNPSPFALLLECSLTARPARRWSSATSPLLASAAAEQTLTHSIGEWD